MRSSPSIPDTTPADFGLYIHIPFCVSKCSYCAFSSVQAFGGLIEEYVDGLHREIDAIARAGTFERRIARTLYFGGGTPSLVHPARIAGLIDHCRRAFPFADDAEITLETNPESASYEKLRACLAAGVTRISLGVQSLDPGTLVELRRAHTPDRVIRAYDAARRAGCTNVNLDLIYGIPGHTPAEWAQTLDAALRLSPDHLSAYALTPESGTAFGTAVQEGRTNLPCEDEIEEQEQILLTAVDRFGFQRYEISNYATPGFTCRHNLLYWGGHDWLGLGASAHSHLSGRRWWNHFDPIEYLRGGRDEAWIEGSEVLEPEQRLAEGLAFGIRLIGGIGVDALRARCRLDPWNYFGATLDGLVADGLLCPTREVIRLTSFGLRHADTVAAGFFP